MGQGVLSGNAGRTPGTPVHVLGGHTIEHRIYYGMSANYAPPIYCRRCTYQAISSLHAMVQCLHVSLYNEQPLNSDRNEWSYRRERSCIDFSLYSWTFVSICISIH